eukprot:GGOE01017882.1.p1 GENE.GGOE01017882.1~~GGOE01017882.1.p1  ORF type:complete len:313 (+),score=67.57 GGOE01017882.1:27-941(+)
MAERDSKGASGPSSSSFQWAEKDVSDWAKRRLTTLLEGHFIVDTPTLKCRTTTVTKVEGEATVYNRRARVTFLLELKFGLNWEGEVFDALGNSVGSCRGKFLVDELEQDMDPSEVNIDMNSSGSERARFHPLMEKEGRAWLRQQIATLFRELGEGRCVSGLLLGDVPPGHSVEYACTVDWRAPASLLWEALTHPGRVSAFTRCNAQWPVAPGANFTLLNGSVRGTFMEVEPTHRLVMSWRCSEWAKGHVSQVSLTLHPEGPARTLLALVHSGVPAARLEQVQHSWRDVFWDPMHILFGFSYEVK